MRKIFLVVSMLIALSGSLAFENSQLPPVAGFSVQWYKAELKNIRDGDTIEVVFADNASFVHAIRLVGVDTPESNSMDPCLNGLVSDATSKLTSLLEEEYLQIGLGSTNDDYIPYYLDKYDRLLGLVQTSGSQIPIQVSFVRDGLARLDVHQSPNGNNFQISGDSDGFSSARLFEEYLQQIVDAQVHAADNRKGWWHEYCDSFGKADLVIAAIKFWSEPQVVYLLNRGSSSFTDLGQLELVDKHGNLLSLKFCSVDSRGLESHKVLEIQTFNHLDKSANPGTISCVFDEEKIIWHVRPKPVAGQVSALWNKTEGEIACLAKEGFVNNCSGGLSAASEGLYYLYDYSIEERE